MQGLPSGLVSLVPSILSPPPGIRIIDRLYYSHRVYMGAGDSNSILPTELFPPTPRILLNN